MAINYSKDDAGIVTLTLDMDGRSANMIDEAFVAALTAAIGRLENDDALQGVILISGKRLWVAGADIDTAFSHRDPARYFIAAEHLKAVFRRLETLGKPVVAALNGTALGGGFELALACHHRIALDDDRIRFGFPEVGLGLLPAAGGVVRTVRLVGLEKGLEWLAQNRQYTPRQTVAAGMVHAVAPNVPTLMEKATAWIRSNPAPQAPWDERGYRIPGGSPSNPRVAQMLAVAPAYLRQETRGNYPAPHAIMAAAVEGAQVDFATACRIESRYFAKLASGQVAQNMIRALWRDMNRIKKGARRPDDVPPQTTRKVGVLGAGMMGHGIAYVSAYAGMEVVLIDVAQAGADAGKAKIADIMDRRVQQGKLATEKRDAILGRITASADYAALQGCDLIIEAVFEKRSLKAKVTAQAEAQMAPDGVFASNTSTLPITSLAQHSVRPERFIGLHFFSPVHKMRLVEIIVGRLTSAAALAKAFDYVLAIGKIPIVVNDSRGFYTSRVFGTWTNEAMALLAEGQDPAAIEMAGLTAGMPVGPLAVLDEVSLSLVDHIRRQTAADLAAAGEAAPDHPAEAVVTRMVALGRTGRSAGAGFYDYGEGAKRLWPGLSAEFGNGAAPLAPSEMVDRLLYIQALETVRCLDEGVLEASADANIGSIFGWGFPACHGGTLQFINATGLAAFVARAEELAGAYGARFAPPERLRRMAADGKLF